MLRFKASIRSTTLPPLGRSVSLAMIVCPFSFSCTSSLKAVPYVLEFLASNAPDIARPQIHRQL